jgi:predicted GIY-YIG superfamily endonuclease
VTLLRENAEGAGTLPTPDAFSRYARATASSDATGRLVTAMPESTSLDAARTTDTPTSVYRYYDAEGRLIYVGVTSRGPQRQAQHAITAEWWPHVRAQDVEHYDNRETALRREKWLIERHRPPFNRQHNPAHEERKARYLAKLTSAKAPCGHCYGCQLAASADPDDRASSDATCRLLLELAEDEEPSICSICNEPACAYQDGIDQGHLDGWRQGYDQGAWQAWERAHEQYAPPYLADLSLRAVIDGHFPPGFISKGIPEAEVGLRDLEADIAEHGVAALVAKAAESSF